MAKCSVKVPGRSWMETGLVRKGLYGNKSAANNLTTSSKLLANTGKKPVVFNNW